MESASGERFGTAGCSRQSGRRHEPLSGRRRIDILGVVAEQLVMAFEQQAGADDHRDLLH